MRHIKHNPFRNTVVFALGVFCIMAGAMCGVARAQMAGDLARRDETALRVPRAEVPQGPRGRRYTQTFPVLGGVRPYTITVAGAIPPGMHWITADNGMLLDGVPQITGEFPITVSVTDAAGERSSQDYVLEITPNDNGSSVNVPVTEPISVTDTPVAGPPIQISITEAVSVTDMPSVSPPLIINITEAVSVTDSASVAPSVFVSISEPISVTDIPSAAPPVMVNVIESVLVTDTPSVSPPVMINITEAVSVTDTPLVSPPLQVSVTEAISVADSVAVAPAIFLAVAEPIVVTDMPVASAGIAQSITFPQPANTTYPGSTTLSATASSGLPVTYMLVSGPATLADSTLTYTGGGTVTVTASQAGNNTYAPATSVTINISVILSQSTSTWEPSALKIYTGTALGPSILDATDSIPATISYSAFLMPSGMPSTVTTSTVLAQGSYGLEALITPDNTAYGAELLEFPFTVQNMNVFIAAQHQNAGTIMSLFNNGTQQSGATSGGGIGAAVDSSGDVWSINADGSGVSKFTDAGALSASYIGVAGINSATALAIDGLGTVWIANGNGTLSVLNNNGSAAFANGMTVTAGGNLHAPASVNVDSAGSLWIANTGNNTVTEVLGVAGPVVTPIAAGVYYNTPGTRP